VKIGYDVTQLTWLSTDSSGNFNIFPTSSEVNVAGYVDAQAGFKVNNVATSANYLRGNGTAFVSAALSASDLASGTVPTARLGSGTANSTTFLSGDQTWKTAVTSVSATVPAEFSVSGVPITTTGTIAVSKVSQNANTVWAGPTSGAADVPTFRSLVNNDLPTGTVFTTISGTFNSNAAFTNTWFSVASGKTYVCVSVDIILIDAGGGPNNTFTFSIGNNTDINAIIPAGATVTHSWLANAIRLYPTSTGDGSNTTFTSSNQPVYFAIQPGNEAVDNVTFRVAIRGYYY
jgi:hypothetical protein